MADLFNVVFRGDIKPGFSVDQVKQDFQALFNLDEQQLAQLFSGRPLAIKKNLPREKAELFCDRLAQVGALVSLKAVEVPGETPPLQPVPSPFSSAGTGTATNSEESGMTLAPVGADVLKDDERQQLAPVQVSTDHLSLDAPGADVLKPEERRKIEPLELDLGHLKVDEA